MTTYKRRWQQLKANLVEARSIAFKESIGMDPGASGQIMRIFSQLLEHMEELEKAEIPNAIEKEIEVPQ